MASTACKTITLSVVSFLETLCKQQTHTYVNVCTYTHTHVSMHVMYVCNECMYVCMYVCMDLFMYLYMVMVLFFLRPQSLRCILFLEFPFGISSWVGGWVLCCCVLVGVLVGG